jgi:hypothetical protein
MATETAVVVEHCGFPPHSAPTGIRTFPAAKIRRCR